MYVLKKFYTKTCAPCKLLAPVLDEIASEREDVYVVHLDVEDYFEEASKYNVRGVPHTVIFRDGEYYDMFIGTLNKTDIVNKLRL